ncbi:hypothetical protein KCU73_g7045, partial [Aureobasidium melanogenum]
MPQRNPRHSRKRAARMSQWNRHLARRIEELVHKCQILENDNADLHDEIQRQKDLQVSASEAYDEIRDKNTRLVAKIHELHEELGQVRKNEESDVVKIRREASQTIREQDLEIEQLQRENVQTQRKDDEINRLQKEVIQYKRLINTSTHVRGQVSDTTIRDKMNGLFSAVRNWAIGVSRQEKLEIEPTRKFLKCLLALVPDFQIGKSKQKMHTLVAVFSLALFHFCNQNYAFGFPSAEPTKSAMSLLRAINRIPDVTKQRKKQWVILTKELLSMDENSWQASATLTEFIHYAGENFEKIMGPSFDSNSLLELKTAVEPFIQVIFDLPTQEAEYRLRMLFAQTDGMREPFEAVEMEDVYGEESGNLEAFLFPAITKEVMKSSDTTEHVFVCKAKVVIIPESIDLN